MFARDAAETRVAARPGFPKCPMVSGKYSWSIVFATFGNCKIVPELVGHRHGLKPDLGVGLDSFPLQNGEKTLDRHGLSVVNAQENEQED